MKAAYYEGEGKISILDVENTSPESKQVKVKIAYVGICGSDVHIAKAHMDERLKKWGLPRVFGHEASGTIVEVGSEVTDWKVGDRVVVYAMRGCADCELCESDNENICLDVKSIGLDCDGAFREYWNVDQDLLFHTPEELDDQQAALVEPLAVTVHAVSRSEIVSGQSAVVIGGGPIGLMTALVLKSKGVDVTVSEISEVRLANCEKMGVKTVNPLNDSLVDYVNSITNGKGVNVVFEASGSQNGLDTAPSLIRPNGKMVTVATFSRPMTMMISAYHFKQISIVTTRAYQKKDYDEAIKLLSNGVVEGKQLISKEISLLDLPEALSPTGVAASPEVVKVMVNCNLEG